MHEETINVLGMNMPKDMFDELANVITPTLKGYKLGCVPQDFECSICCAVRDVDLDRPCVFLECNHVFHLDCIEEWITKRNDCPLCRNVLPGSIHTLVEKLMTGVKEHFKRQVMEGWVKELENMTDEQVLEAQQRMNDFVQNQGWNQDK